MAPSLLEQLPTIVAEGEQQAAQILERLEGRTRLTLRTRELVLPNKSSSGLDLAPLDTEFDVNSLGTAPNRLIYGDNLLAIAALLAGDHRTPTMRRSVDLIYIDPPVDSKANDRTRLTLPSAAREQSPNVMEQLAGSGARADDTASHLQMLAPRLFLMRELLSETGSIVVHLDGRAGSYARVLLDGIFGRENFRNEVMWSGDRRGAKVVSGRLPRDHDSLLVYGRRPSSHDNPVFERRSIPIDEASGLHRDPDSRWFTTSPCGDDTDLRIAVNMSRSERPDWGTSTPEKLIERLIDIACPAGGLVADFFAGSGMTAAVAERMDRRWVATDLGKPAIMVARKRLIDQQAKPFLQQEIGDDQMERVRSDFGGRSRGGDLARTILGIYGALPLPPEENLDDTLGRIDNDRTLVFADSPSQLTSITTLQRAQNWRESKLGGFNKVVVLGWSFPAGIGQEIERLADPRLEVRVIAPHLLDPFTKSGQDRLNESAGFAALQHLEAHIVARFPRAESEELVIELDNYAPLSPEAINLRSEDRDKVLTVMNREPLALVDYWAIDPDYDGELFRSVWQDYRGNSANHDDALHIATKATVTAPRHDGPRQVCVRAVDVFGVESEVVLDVAEYFL